MAATGSHTVDLKRSAERLPGRRGESSDAMDKIMSPTKFSEFVSIMDREMGQVIRDNFLRLSAREEIFERYIFNNEAAPALDGVRARLPSPNRHLEDYVLTGGVPKAVGEYV